MMKPKKPVKTPFTPCPKCVKAINKWYDSKPSQMQPHGGSFAFGSGAPYDVSAAGIRDASKSRHASWVALVRTNIATIRSQCAAGQHG